MNVVANELHFDAQFAEDVGYYAQVFDAGVFDGDVGACHCGQSDKRTHFNHVSQQSVCGAVKLVNTFYLKEVGAYAFYMGTHGCEHAAKLHQIWLAGGVENCGLALSHDCGHHYVGRTCHRSLVKQHVSAFQAVGRRHQTVAVVHIGGLHGGAEFLQSDEVSVQTSASYLVTTRSGHITHAEAGQ